MQTGGEQSIPFAGPNSLEGSPEARRIIPGDSQPGLELDTTADKDGNAVIISEALNPNLGEVVTAAKELEEDDTSEEPLSLLSAFADNDMSLYKNVKLVYGPVNTIRTGLYKFAPTSWAVDSREAHVQAGETANAARRMLIAAANYPGRFTDSFREWIIQEVGALTPGAFDNQNAVKAQLEAFSGVLARQYAMHYKTKQAALRGDSSVEPGGASKAQTKMEAIRTMQKVIGAPVLLGLDPTNGEEVPELDVRTQEDMTNKMKLLVEIGFLEAGDYVQFGGRKFRVRNRGTTNAGS